MGISATEYILQSKLTEIIQYVKDNIDVIDDIFDDVSTEIRDRIKAFWTEKNIIATIGYPRDAQSIPEYVILLNQESETDKSIGDNESEPYLPDDTESITGETLTTDDYINFYTEHFPVDDNHYTVYRDGSAVSGSEFNFDSKQGKITFLTKQDSGSTFTIDYYYYPYYSQFGATYFSETYQIECWAEDSESAVWLFDVAKYFLLFYRRWFAVEYGFYIQELMGKDVEPVTVYEPQFVFRRTLVFSTERENTWLKRYDILENISVNGDLIR